MLTTWPLCQDAHVNRKLSHRVASLLHRVASYILHFCQQWSIRNRIQSYANSYGQKKILAFLKSPSLLCAWGGRHTGLVQTCPLSTHTYPSLAQPPAHTSSTKSANLSVYHLCARALSRCCQGKSGGGRKEKVRATWATYSQLLVPALCCLAARPPNGYASNHKTAAIPRPGKSAQLLCATVTAQRWRSHEQGIAVKGGVCVVVWLS